MHWYQSANMQPQKNAATLKLLEPTPMLVSKCSNGDIAEWQDALPWRRFNGKEGTHLVTNVR
jgi:hypothetical protein